MNKQRYILLVLAIMFSGFFSFSQTLSGTVIDEFSKQPIPGVVVELPELQKGIVTDENGVFVFDVIPKGDFKLQISSFGYKSVILSCNTDKSKKIEIAISPTLIETEKIVISGGNFSSAHSNAVKVDMVKISDLKTTGNLSGFLDNISGVDIISQGLGVTKPVIRGLSGTNILMLNNGFRLENYQFSEHHPFLVDEIGTDRVEVIKGPASLLYGSDAVGGVINMIAEKPAPIGKFNADYNASYFSNTNGILQNIGIKSSTEKFMWGFRAGLISHQDFYDANKNQVKNSRFNRYLAKAFFIFNAKNAVFKLNYEFSKSLLGMPNEEAITLVNNNLYKNEIWYQNLNNNLITSQNTYFLNKIRLKANFSYQNNKRGLVVKEDVYGVKMFLQNVTYETKMEYSKESFSIISGFQGNYAVNKNLEGAVNKIMPDYSSNTNALFTLLKYNFADKFNLQSGIRYEISNIKIKAQDYHEIFNETKKFDYENFSGSIGATYNPIHELNFRINFASAYRMPNIAELTQFGVHELRFEQGNLDLKSQRSFEGDFSAHFHSKKILFDFALFYNKIDNYIYLSPTNDTTADGYEIFKHIQNNADLYGFETGVEVYPIKTLDIKGTYSYIIGKQNKEYLPFIPHNKLKINANLILGDLLFAKNINFGISSIYAFEQNKVSEEEEISPEYFLLNANLNFNVFINKQQISIQFAGTNLLNTLYVDHLSELKENGYYDMGRNFVISLKIPIEN
ncbi:MAG: TonB-dependent receptor [Bacteroidales bacterium]|nr:TonB-dependent receptor [Bacteroidales bacterium]